MSLPSIQGSPTFVGLRTLLEGGQSELLSITNIFLSYLESGSDFRDDYGLTYPDLFQTCSFREQAVPEYLAPLVADGQLTGMSENRPENLGLSAVCSKLDINHIVAVIEALFAVFNSSDLLDNFQAIVAEASHEQQGNPAPDVANQTPVPAAPARLRVPKVLNYRFWAEVIGGNNINQPRYYLGNLLAFDVILKIINQMLDSGRNDDALELARRLSQLPGVIQVTNAFPDNAPNYFEAIILRVTLEQPAGFEDLAHATQRAGNVDVELLYKCYRGLNESSPRSVIRAIFSLWSVDPQKSFLANLSRCVPVIQKYSRGG